MSRRSSSATLWVLALVVVGACAESPSESTSTTNQSSMTTVDVPDAVAIRVVAGLDGSAWVAWTAKGELWLANLNPEAATLAPGQEMSGAEGVIDHPLERPAVAVSPDGLVAVAWISEAGQVVTRILGTETTAVVSGDARPETALVQMIATSDGGSVLSWLEDSTLSVATGMPDAVIEHENVDDLTCDCCHPVPIELADGIGVGYRDLERGSEGVVRDIRFVRGMVTGQFGEPVEVADDRWFLDACPLSGPTLGTIDGEVMIAWMDARQSIHPDQSSSSIWFDRSVDGGKSFGPDLRLTEHEAVHGTPSMAVDPGGVLHLVWEHQTAEESSIEYTRSTDGGDTFAETQAVVRSASNTAPREVSLAVSGGHLLISWVDGDGGHIGVLSNP